MLAITQFRTLPTRAGLLVAILVLGGCSGAQVTGNAPSDASISTSSTSSSITSTPPSNAGSATLTWVPPADNTDGTPITNLAGFHIYYGTSADALTQTINVPGPTATTYVVGDLAPGTYYFAVTAYNSSGTESTQSNIGSKTI